MRVSETRALPLGYIPRRIYFTHLGRRGKQKRTNWKTISLLGPIDMVFITGRGLALVGGRTLPQHIDIFAGADLPLLVARAIFLTELRHGRPIL